MEEVQLQEHLAKSVLQAQAVMEAQHKLSALLEALLLVEAQAAKLVEMIQATLLLELCLA